jgi:hypothetical protein
MTSSTQTRAIDDIRLARLRLASRPLGPVGFHPFHHTPDVGVCEDDCGLSL